MARSLRHLLIFSVSFGLLSNALFTACAGTPPHRNTGHISKRRHLANAELIALWAQKSVNFDPNMAISLTPQAVQRALDRGADINASDQYGQTALIIACDFIYNSRTSHAAMVRYLLAHGANVNSGGNDTPLVEALSVGLPPKVDSSVLDQRAVVNLLLARGAKVNAKTIDGTTPLMKAWDPPMAINAKNKNDNGRSPLIEAARKGDVSVVKALLAKGADINAVDNDGQTALMEACTWGKGDVVPLLLAKGADVNAQGELHDTAMADAIEADSPVIVRLLLDHGVGVDAKVNEDDTPLLHAALSGQSDIINLLLNRGADITARDALDETPLMVAAQEGNPDAVKTLLHRGEPVNERNSEGMTPLMAVGTMKFSNSTSAHSKDLTVKVLLDHGANINARDKKGKTALMYATDVDLDDTIKLLLHQGADLNIRNKKGQTALSIAQNDHYPVAVKILRTAGAK